MSSAGHPAAGGGGAMTRYFCHQCNRTVAIEPSDSGELICPDCHGGFIEEFNLPSPGPTPNPPVIPLNPAAAPFFALNPSATPFFPAASSSPAFLSRSTSFDLRNPGDLFSLIGPEFGHFHSPPFIPDSGFFPSPSVGSDPGLFASSSANPNVFNPVDFLQRYIQTLLNDGANIQIVVEGGDRPIGNIGDYFIGPGLEQLIQQLAENDPNRHGTPPAAKTAVASLPDVQITENLLASEDAQCAVCKECFEIGEVAKQMPCKHIFHKDCILPWLELHNSCPVCRYELPTDDPDYEQRMRDRNRPPTAAEGVQSLDSGGSSGAPAESEAQNSTGQRLSPLERRFRISLPWPFRGLGSQPDASSEGDAQSGGENGGANDEASNGQGGSEPDTRQRDSV